MKKFVKSFRGIAVITLMLLLVTNLSVRTFYFPLVVESYEFEDIEVVALARPTNPFSLMTNLRSLVLSPVLLLPELGVCFGNIHNYTQMDVEIRKDGKVIAEHTLAGGEDRPSYHVPYSIQRVGDEIVVSEAKNGASFRFKYPL